MQSDPAVRLARRWRGTLARRWRGTSFFGAKTIGPASLIGCSNCRKSLAHRRESTRCAPVDTEVAPGVVGRNPADLLGSLNAVETVRSADLTSVVVHLE